MTPDEASLRLGLSHAELNRLRGVVLKDRTRVAATLLTYLEEECNEGRNPKEVAEEVAHLCIALGIEPELLGSMVDAAQSMASDVIAHAQAIPPDVNDTAAPVRRASWMAAGVRLALSALTWLGRQNARVDIVDEPFRVPGRRS